MQHHEDERKHYSLHNPTNSTQQFEDINCYTLNKSSTENVAEIVEALEHLTEEQIKSLYFTGQINGMVRFLRKMSSDNFIERDLFGSKVLKFAGPDPYSIYGYLEGKVYRNVNKNIVKAEDLRRYPNVSVNANELAGYSSYSGQGGIFRIDIIDTFQNKKKGVGTALLESLFKDGYELIEAILVNDQSFGFFEKMGFDLHYLHEPDDDFDIEDFDLNYSNQVVVCCLAQSSI